MNSKTAYFLITLLVIAAFLGGSLVTRIQLAGKKPQASPAGEVAGEKEAANPQASEVPFDAPDQDKPEVEFFVMSFCPYGNQAEEGLEPVYKLLKDKVSWQPRYIVGDKKQSCEEECNYRVFDQQKCDELISQKRIPDMAACKEYFSYDKLETCINEKCKDLVEGEFTSLHGDQELNQDVREICVYKEMGVEKYWQFVMAVNKGCSSQDADTCWTKVADEVGLDKGAIETCEKDKGKDLLKEEAAVSSSRQVSGSPTIFINGQLYNGGRSPENYKKGICTGFKEQPSECSQVLGTTSSSAPAGGCK